MTISNTKLDKRGRGRPRGLGPRTTCCSHGAYAKDLNAVYNFWIKHSPHLAAQVDLRSASYARALCLSSDDPHFSVLRTLAILTISRELLLMKIIEQDFTRAVHDPVTGYEIRKRPSDQFARLEAIDMQIQERLTALGLIKSKVINEYKETK